MNRLKELRQEKGLTQQALADEIGVFYRTIQNWENGKSQIKPEKAQQLADHFGVSVGYLLGYSDETLKKNKKFDSVILENQKFISNVEKIMLDKEIEFTNLHTELDKEGTDFLYIYALGIYQTIQRLDYAIQYLSKTEKIGNQELRDYQVEVDSLIKNIFRHRASLEKDERFLIAKKAYETIIDFSIENDTPDN